VKAASKDASSYIDDQQLNKKASQVCQFYVTAHEGDKLNEHDGLMNGYWCHSLLTFSHFWQNADGENYIFLSLCYLFYVLPEVEFCINKKFINKNKYNYAEAVYAEMLPVHRKKFKV
jgi:hypothetical protein